MTEKPELQEMSEQLLDLWQEQLSRMAADPAFMAAWSGKMAAALQNPAASPPPQDWLQHWSQLWQNPLHPSAPPTPQDRHAQASPASAAPAAAAAAMAAQPDGSHVLLSQLGQRLALMEARMALMEARLDAAGRGADPKTP